MKDFSLDFGPVVAFILPGLACLWAVSDRRAPVVGPLYDVTEGGLTVSLFLLIVLVALGVGLFLAGLRYCTLEQWFRKRKPKYNKLDYRSLAKREQTDKAFRGIVDSFWFYYLFYGNLFVAIPAAALFRLYAVWLEGEPLKTAFGSYAASGSFGFVKGASVLVILALAELVLYGSARSAWDNYYESAQEILKAPER